MLVGDILVDFAFIHLEIHSFLFQINLNLDPQQKPLHNVFLFKEKLFTSRIVLFRDSVS